MMNGTPTSLDGAPGCPVEVPETSCAATVELGTCGGGVPSTPQEGLVPYIVPRTMHKVR
jgi:hypothetical protein